MSKQIDIIDPLVNAAEGQHAYPEIPAQGSPCTRFGEIPTLVFGSSLTGLGVLRSLGRARIPAYSLCPPNECMVKSSWYRTLPETDGGQPRVEELARFLVGLDLPRAVLMPCSDDWLTAVSQLPSSIQQRFPASCSSAAAIHTCVDKWHFAQMLQQHGLPHPRTELLRSVNHMRSVPDRRYYGSFLKPIASLEFGRRHHVKAFLIKDKQEAIRRMTPALGDKATDFPILLQEYIPGPPTNHYFIDGFVDRYGTIKALFARRRLRMYPPWLGNSTLMETVAIEQVAGAAETVRKLVAAVAYRGVFSAEFKYDDRDGAFKILEVNARPWWFIEFATRCGVDVCRMAYQDALEMPVDAVHSYDVGRRCVYLLNDFRAYRQNSAGSLFSWLRSIFGADEAVFSWDDYRPALSSFSESLKLRIGKR